MAGPTETFGSQADAESWIGQAWRELAAAGVTSVILVEDDRVEYRMSLLPAPTESPRGAASIVRSRRPRGQASCPPR